MATTATKRFEVRKDESKMLKVYCGKCNDITSHEIKFKSLDERIKMVTYTSLCNLCCTRAHLKYEKEPEATTETLNKKEFCFLWDVKLYDD